MTVTNSNRDSNHGCGVGVSHLKQTPTPSPMFHLDFCVILLQSIMTFVQFILQQNSVCTLLCTFYYKRLKTTVLENVVGDLYL